MPQLQKATRKVTRDIRPCVRCLKDHATWMHGKTADEIAEQLRSRQINPKDPLYAGKPLQQGPTNANEIGKIQGL